MDDVNRRLIRALEENGRISLVELGRKVDLSASAVSERVRRLEEEGVIASYHTRVNAAKLGFHVRAFLGISAERDALRPIIALARATPEVKEMHQIGPGRFLLRVIARDNDDLRRITSYFEAFGPVESSPILATPVEKYTT